MYSKLIILPVLLCSILLSSHVFAGYVVVANESMKADSIKAKDLRNIYLKKKRYLYENQVAEPTGLEDGEARLEFISKVLRKTESTLNSYWSRLIFTGRANPPRLFSSQDELMQYIARTPGAIGYMDSDSTIIQGVKIIEFE